ncbi:hypothetical protein BAUCODRAFT_31108 [Baudoinia panamericana UAMH 10762]|uniref:Uncharacterized protein n=1 Tax=Baudoinia panamericana (strain UAMH 10762) TaxID=717646 RepID=M2NIC2_BAUPA|nr:uncharacterized protein BAUCODRAFT_31108 [Baudoinia panamericana UAMH 10762]EMC98840.1 hypothetical protein BAUCODRAFT_31108 [Baudoinia panamericana UAMH 10762]
MPKFQDVRLAEGKPAHACITLYNRFMKIRKHCISTRSPALVPRIRHYCHTLEW